MAMKFEKLSSKFIKPLVPTPPSLKHYKISFIDELIPFMNVSIVLFFTKNSNRNVVHLQKSLEKTLVRLYPLAGRYVEASHTIDCNDQGVEFTQSTVNIKLEDVVSPKVNVKSIDEFIPFITTTQTVVLKIQLTTFKCGGVALGVSATHKAVDASTLSTFLYEWVATSREVNEIKFTTPGFNSSSLFSARGVHSISLPLVSGDDMVSKYTRKKVSFSESVISKLKAKAMVMSGRRLSKVQLALSVIWKALIGVDRAKHDCQRESILYQMLNLRERMASPIHKFSCGNLVSMCPIKLVETSVDDGGLANVLSDYIKKVMNEYSKVHHDSEEGQMMVLNSFLNIANINPETTDVIISTSWCKFPFYELDFGFGKPIWVVPGTMPIKKLVHLIDDAQGNGLEAYIFLELKDVPCFEAALDINVFGSVL
ncbi:hypothetical protein QVD17_04278 [Tagetes erecta]|uniref:Transferase, Chloramphenicol acetyltransferase-like domain protein n=1 Tax=Tagetes erecta TaxID=13708 RepID=A0AAD8PAB4_TARER|nr:hypothetical protein QVD17_04278 [Tagetes erecta]